LGSSNPPTGLWMTDDSTKRWEIDKQLKRYRVKNNIIRVEITNPLVKEEGWILKGGVNGSVCIVLFWDI